MMLTENRRDNILTTKLVKLFDRDDYNDPIFPNPDVILNHLAEHVIILDPDLRILWSNRIVSSEAEVGSEQLIGQHCYRKWWNHCEPCVDCPVVNANWTGRPQIIEQKAPDGTNVLIRAEPVLDSKGNVIYIIETAIDVSLQKQTEEKLQVERINFRNSFQSLPFGIQIINATGNLVFINQTMLEMWGFETIEQLREKRLDQVFTPESVLLVSNLFGQRMTSKVPPVHELTMVCNNNQLRHVRVNAREMIWNGEQCVQLCYEDITETKRIKKGINRLSDTLELIKALDRLIAREEKENDLLQKGCDEIVKSQQYALAWIGFLEEETGEIPPVALAGQGIEYLNEVQIKLNDSPDGQGPVNIAFKTGKPCVISDIETDPRCGTWKEIAVKRGFKSVIALPMKVQRKVIGILNIYTEQPDAFRPAKAELLEELAEDLSAGIEKIRHRDENHKAQQALADEAVRRRVFMERSTDGIVILDQNGKVFEANKRFCEMLGYTSDEILKLHIWDWDNEYSHDELVTMANSITDAGPRIETKHRRKDGSIFDVDITSNAAVFAGHKLTYCVCRDISEKKKAQENLRISEERYRTLVAISPDGIVSISTKGIITFASDQIYKIFGYPDEKEVIGQPVLNWISADDREKMASNIKKALMGEDVGIHEYHVCRRDGELFWIEANSSIIKDTQGNATGLLGIIRDITERKKMQDSLIMTDRLASIGELASGMAHELNNPLTAVIGFADIILEEEDISTIREEIVLLNREAKRMAEVTKNMLTFARKHPAMKTQLNINDIITKVNEIRAYEHRLNNMQVITSLAEDLPEITGDYFQLQQVVLNIVINAEYFMKEAHNGGILDIRTEKTNTGIRLSITDNGPGIVKENLTRIFDPFFTTKPIGKGTGLGLSICFGIIHEHDGNIYAESEPGKGTTFIIELPVKQ
jgi:PAS domain S-box-containing protein